MSDFFEPLPPPPPRPQRYRRPPWTGPPEGTLPGVVALELVLVETNQLAIAISRIGGYTSGFEFEVLAIAGPDRQELMDPATFHGLMGGPHAKPDALRIGVQFADGSKATTMARFHSPGMEKPDAPVLTFAGGGGGGGGRWRYGLWVWPLPPPGPLAFVCEWPALEIPVTRREIEAQDILDAAGRARVIFSDDDLPEAPSGPAPSLELI